MIQSFTDDTLHVKITGVEFDDETLKNKYTVERLNQLISGASKVLLTRENDINPGGSGQAASLKARVDFSKKNLADIFVSIHVNDAGKNENADAVSIHSQPTSSKTSNILSSNIAAALKPIVKSKEGVKEIPQDLFVCRLQPKIGVVLVEIGFITNKEQEAAMNTDEYLQKIGFAIADGIFKTAFPNIFIT